MADLVALVGRNVGFEPQVFADPKALADLLREFPTSALVLDLVMPDVDGLEVLKILGRDQFKGPILILSGMDPMYLEAAARSAQRLGLRFAGAISKPIDLAALGEALASMAQSLMGE